MSSDDHSAALAMPLRPASVSSATATAPQPSTGSFYRPELDGLRFFAFFAVYLEHTVSFGLGEHHHLPQWLGDGFTTLGLAGTFGVDLFFVLSSYLITTLLLRERRVRGVLDVKAFYIRRMLRIWPLYFLFVFFSYGLTFVVPSEGMTWRHLLGFLFFAGNWVYFLMPVATVAGPLWSVSLEEQFYLLWPWVVRRLSAQRIGWVALGAIAVSLLSTYLIHARHPDVDWISKNSFTRIDGIAVGALLAVWLRGGVPRLRPATRLAILLASLAVLMWVARDFGLFDLPVATWAVMAGWPLAAIACGSILYSVLGTTGRASAFLRSRPLVYLGRISYGLYVYHELFLLIGGHLFPQHTSSSSQMVAYWLFGLATTLPVAAASYQWLELPFLRLKRRRFTVVPSRPD